MINDEIEGSDVLHWLRKAEHGDETALLSVCLVYDPKTDTELQITGIDFENQTINCRGPDGPRKVHFNALTKRQIIDRTPRQELSKLVDKHRPPPSASERLFQETKKLGGGKEISNDHDAVQLLQAIDYHRAKKSAPDDLRHAAFNLIKKHQLFTLGRKLADQWAQLAKDAGPPYPADIYIQIAYYARAFRNPDRAIRATDVLFLEGRLACSSTQRAILETIRAAALLDKFLDIQEAELLFRCRQHLGRAYFINQSEYTSAVYRRLEVYEEAQRAGESRSFWRSQLARLSDPEDIPIHSH